MNAYSLTRASPDFGSNFVFESIGCSDGLLSRTHFGQEDSGAGVAGGAAAAVGAESGAKGKRGAFPQEVPASVSKPKPARIIARCARMVLLCKPTYLGL